MVQIYRKIDPNGEMGESERNLYALNIVHQFKMNQGDPEGAARTAGQMLQHYKQAATRYAAITAAASETGDVDATMKAALKAYAQVPDGNDMKMSKTKDGHINWEVTGPDGKKITGGLATPEEIGATAMGLATPGGFENYLVQMASGAKLGGGTVTGGARGKKPEETGQADTPKPSEYRELKQEQTDKAVDDWYAAYLKGPEFKANGGKESTPKELASAKNMLYHIRRNNDVTDDEGLRRIQTIISAPEPTKKGEAPPFRAVEDKENKTWNVQFPDGGELSIPSTQIGMFKSARVENLQAKAAAAKAAAEKADRKSGLEMADEAFNKAALGTAADVKERAGRVAENFPNAAKNVREGVEGIAGVAGEAGDWLKRFAQAGPGGSMIGGTGYEGPGDVYGEVNKAVGGVGSKIGRAATAADEALKGGAGHLVGRAIGRALTGPATAVPTDPYEDRPL
jgi:hypothetical protein